MSRDCPEGKEWCHINTNGQSIINISVGPTGRVWAVTWDGTAYVRIGLSRDSIYGNYFFYMLLQFIFILLILLY